MIFICLLLPVYNSSSDLFKDFYTHKLFDCCKITYCTCRFPHYAPSYHDKPHVTSVSFP